MTVADRVGTRRYRKTLRSTTSDRLDVAPNAKCRCDAFTPAQRGRVGEICGASCGFYCADPMTVEGDCDHFYYESLELSQVMNPQTILPTR